MDVFASVFKYNFKNIFYNTDFEKNVQNNNTIIFFYIIL